MFCFTVCILSLCVSCGMLSGLGWPYDIAPLERGNGDPVRCYLTAARKLVQGENSKEVEHCT